MSIILCTFFTKYINQKMHYLYIFSNKYVNYIIHFFIKYIDQKMHYNNVFKLSRKLESNY